MRRLFEFQCTDEGCQHTFDEYVEYSDIHTVKCPECDSPAQKQISVTRIDPRLGLDPSGFPTMADKWARVRRQRARIERSRSDG